MKERAVFRIDITQQAVKRLIDFSQKSGVTQIAIASNLATWFATQPEAIQKAILDSDADGARLVLERMARKDRPRR
ncbi:MAG: hypothetical protein JWM57_4342 [Phycisphaerales bacterium]|nr:hypothetical protein [Phycisphaerales bacterium]